MGKEVVLVGTGALTSRQQIFVEEYLRCWKAGEAARRAGYSAKNARSTGSVLLKRADVKAVIRERLAAEAMATDEVLARLAEQARGNLGEFLVVEEVDGRTQVRFDWARLVREGKGHLLRAVTVNGARIEFYDAQAALGLLAKHLGVFEQKRGEEQETGLSLAEWEVVVHQKMHSEGEFWMQVARAEIAKEGNGMVEGEGRLLEG